MKKHLLVWKFILENLSKNISVMLLYVLESNGSSPGRQGFFMAVNEKKEMQGSIGGGIMEHKFVEMAKERLERGNKQKEINEKIDPEIRKQIHDKAAGKNQSGMICSGEQTILIYHVEEKDIYHIEKIISTLEENKNGTLHLSPEGILFDENIPVKNFEFDLKSEDDWYYTEKIGLKNNLYIVGGGHCALALSKIMYEMDFNIHLFEERENLNTIEKNDFVHKKTIVKDYSELSNIIPSGKKNYVVIMTFGYRTDDIAVRALLYKDFKYVGLLGSRKKIEKMFDDYRNEGLDESHLKKIHSPIGIQIKSQTPEEIAISIASEIIKLKNSEYN